MHESFMKKKMKIIHIIQKVLTNKEIKTVGWEPLSSVRATDETRYSSEGGS